MDGRKDDKQLPRMIETANFQVVLCMVIVEIANGTSVRTMLLDPNREEGQTPQRAIPSTVSVIELALNSISVVVICKAR